MAENILSPDTTPKPSDHIVVDHGEEVLIALYTEDGSDCPSGVALRIQRQAINGKFMSVSTPGYGAVYLSRDAQQIILTTPGVYRVLRPDISNWNIGVGVQKGI